MKTDEEMMASLLKRADIYHKERKRKIKVYSGAVMSLALLTVFILPTLKTQKKMESEGPVDNQTLTYDNKTGNASVDDTDVYGRSSNQQLIEMENLDELDQEIRELIENNDYQENEIIELGDNSYFAVITVNGIKYIAFASDTNYSSFAQYVDQNKNVKE